MIYDKSVQPFSLTDYNVIPCKNVGGEVESFFRYITDHYDKLPDYVLFVRGNPFEYFTTRINGEQVSIQNIRARIDALVASKPSIALPLFNRLTVENGDGYSQLFEGNVPAEFEYSVGCQYIVPKNVILSRPVSFHRKMRTREDLEKLLWYIFSDSPLTKPVANTYLVTGGCGFIGSNLVRRLVDRGDTVYVIDNFSTGNIKLKESDQLKIIEGDITNFCFSFTGLTGIFHLAAMSKVLPSIEDPSMHEFCQRQNVLGTINVLKFAASFQPPIKVVYSASSTYYGNGKTPSVETQPHDCQTPYAVSKYGGELQCELFSRLYNVPTVRLRYFMVFGENEPSVGPYAIASGIFAKRKREGLPLIVHGDGSQTRDFVYVGDVCEANIRAMENNKLINETINVGTGRQVSIKRLATLISDDIQYVEKRKFDMLATEADTTKCETLLGWKPTVKIEDWI